MLRYFTLCMTFMCLLNATQAQFKYTGGPSNFDVEWMKAIGDSVVAISGNKIFLNSLKNFQTWNAFERGAANRDSTVWALETFKRQFFLARGVDKVFTLSPGQANWQNISAGLKLGHEPESFFNLGDKELLLRCFNVSEEEYYWYQLDQQRREWRQISPSLVGTGEPALVLLPNGNIQAYTYSDDEQQFLAVFEAATRQWRRVDTIPLQIFRSVIALSNTELLAGGYDTEDLYRSKDGGRNWSPEVSPIPFVSADVTLYKANKVIYLLSDEYLGKSLDGGRTWEDIEEFPLIEAGSAFYGTDSTAFLIASGIPLFYVSEGGFETSFTVQAKAPFICRDLLVTANEVYFYGVGGISILDEIEETLDLRALNRGLPKVVQAANELRKAGSDLVGIAGNAFYRYNASQGWRLSMDSLDLFLPYLLGSELATLGDSVFLFDGLGFTHYSPNRGQRWETQEDILATAFFTGFTQGKKHLFVGVDNIIYRWMGKKQRFEPIKSPGDEIFLRSLHLKGDTLMASTDLGWFYTLDAGARWKQMRPVPREISFFYSNETAVYGVGLFEGLMEINAEGAHRVFRGGPADANINYVVRRDSLVLALPTFDLGYLYSSTNRGRTWKTLRSEPLGGINQALFDGDLVYFATESGVWTMPIRNLTTGLFDPKPLAQNTLRAWPNPSPDGRFSIQDPAAEMNGALHARVFDLQGRQVYENKTRAWNHQVDLDLGALPAGQYNVVLFGESKAWAVKVLRQ
jgi:hypothetical protein